MYTRTRSTAESRFKQVTVYLSTDAILETLRFVASLPKGSAITFDYRILPSLVGSIERAVGDYLANMFADPMQARPSANRARTCGSGMGDAAVTTILSRPTGFSQHGVEGFNNVISSVSIMSVELGFDTVANKPNVGGTVPDNVNTVVEFSMPLIT